MVGGISSHAGVESACLPVYASVSLAKSARPCPGLTALFVDWITPKALQLRGWLLELLSVPDSVSLENQKGCVDVWEAEREREPKSDFLFTELIRANETGMQKVALVKEFLIEFLSTRGDFGETGIQLRRILM